MKTFYLQYFIVIRLTFYHLLSIHRKIIKQNIPKLIKSTIIFFYKINYFSINFNNIFTLFCD